MLTLNDIIPAKAHDIRSKMKKYLNVPILQYPQLYLELGIRVDNPDFRRAINFVKDKMLQQYPGMSFEDFSSYPWNVLRHDRFSHKIIDLLDQHSCYQLLQNKNNICEFFRIVMNTYCTNLNRPRAMFISRYKYGKTLQDVGEEYNVTRETVRVSIEKYISRLSFLTRDFIDVFFSYDADRAEEIVTTYEKLAPFLNQKFKRSVLEEWSRSQCVHDLICYGAKCVNKRYETGSNVIVDETMYPDDKMLNLYNYRYTSTSTTLNDEVIRLEDIIHEQTDQEEMA